MKNVSDTEAAHGRRYQAAIREARAEGTDSFQSWFNTSPDARVATIRGHWDFSIHVLTPGVCRLISHPEDKTALEIGYGGGRILNAACEHFGSVIGIDVHDEAATVAEFLRQQGRSNFRLLHTDASRIDVDTSSIDFIYSFIVLQHLPTFATFERYFTESFRCLRPGGIAQMYFGRFSVLPLAQQIRCWPRGYCELPRAPVNHTSLVVRRTKAMSVARTAGFDVAAVGKSYKRVPDGYPDAAGGQCYLTLVKPDR